MIDDFEFVFKLRLLSDNEYLKLLLISYPKFSEKYG